MGGHLTEAHLKSLTSYIRYSNFEPGQSGCENIPFYTNIKDEIQDRYPNLQIISDKILKALCYIYNEKTNLQNKLDEEYCSYLYYWLGHNILENLLDKSLFKKIIKIIFEELQSSGMHSTCNYLYEKIDENTFETYKLLFDYSKDYVNVNLSTSHGYTTCNQEYKKFIQNYINIYKDAHKNCTENNEKKYDCEYFNKLFPIKQFDKLSSFICPQRQNDRPIIEELRENKSQETATTEDFRLNRATVSTFQHSKERVRELVRHHGKQNQENIQTIQPLPINDTTEGGSSKTIAGSVAPVLGVSSISLLLYKVTPLGGFIRNFLGRNRNMYNPVEYMESFNPYNDGMDPGGRTMNISYHRL